MTDVEALLEQMLKENTGRHICDSGGAYGRHWEQNQEKKFIDEPEATLRLHWWTDSKGKEHIEPDVTINLFHLLRQVLDLDGLCEEFNAKPVENWDSEFYGVSTEGEAWLKEQGFEKRYSYNTYNGEAGYIHSQVTQGTVLYNGRFDGWYVLLQIHGGADVRGGYTHAKLFYLGEYEDEAYLLDSTRASFLFGELDDEVLSIDVDNGGEVQTYEGHDVDEKYLKRCAEALGMKIDDERTITGEIYV